MWGVNPSASGIHLVPYIREAQRNGATLIVIDPRTTPLAKQADIHLADQTRDRSARSRSRFTASSSRRASPIARSSTRTRATPSSCAPRPLPWTFERAAAEAGVSADRTRDGGRAVRGGDAGPDPLRLGTGAQPQRRQLRRWRSWRCPAVAGKFGVRGGGYAMSNTAAWGIERTWIGAQEPATRLVNMNQLGRALTELDPPVRVLFVYNSNAAVTSPDQQRIIRGLERDDLFTVVFEQVMTDTARYADVILPATTFLEGYDLVRGYGPISLRLGKPVIEAVGEARPNADVFGELLHRLDLAEPADPRGELEEMLHVIARLPGSSGDELSRAWRSDPAGRWPPDSVRRRAPANSRPQGRSVSRAPGRPVARGLVRLSAGSRRRTNFPLR